VTDQHFIFNVIATAVLTFYLVRFHELPASVLMVADAFALALFTMIGTRKGLAFHLTPSIAILMGITTGVAGGMLRDLLIGEIPLVFRSETCLYATAAFGGALVFTLLDEYSGSSETNEIISTLATLLLRLAGIRWRIRLPMFRPKTSQVERRQ
jgi:uncharacterized membrane protein YeiH